MEIEDFLEHNVEGYLFYDLTALAPSGVGYPWLMTSFGGIELFGALLSQRSFDHSRSESYFVSYWSKHLYRERDRTVAQGRALYKLVRHDIAHSFIPKGPIHVAGQNGWRHLTVDPTGNLFVDPERLADDLKASYFRDVRPVLRKSTGRVSRTTMNRRLQQMRAAANSEAADLHLALIFPARPEPPVGA
jgi:hypothetical protein